MYPVAKYIKIPCLLSTGLHEYNSFMRDKKHGSILRRIKSIFCFISGGATENIADLKSNFKCYVQSL